MKENYHQLTNAKHESPI